jgi:hypothetical protein
MQAPSMLSKPIFVLWKPDLDVIVASVFVKTAAFQGPAHPFSTAKMQLECTYGRILRLDTAVELSPGTFVQYNAMEAKTFWKESVTQTKFRKESEDHCYDNNTFFNAYENLPPFHEDFFDCFEEEKFENNEQHQVRDRLNLDYVHCARIVVDCTKEIIGTGSKQESTSSEPNIPGTLLAQEPTEYGKYIPGPEANLSPSNMALSALIGETILCPVGNSVTSKWVLSIILDTGASLAITPDLSDFVEPPKPLARSMRLGGMANSIEIAVMGIIAWTFTVKDGIEVQIRTEAYHLPSAKQILLSPQRLFNKKKGIFGTFSGDEDKFELHLNEYPVISGPYDILSSLLIIESLCGPEPEPTVNISILETQIKTSLQVRSFYLSGITDFSISTFSRYNSFSEELHLWQKGLLQL